MVSGNAEETTIGRLRAYRPLDTYDFSDEAAVSMAYYQISAKLVGEVTADATKRSSYATSVLRDWLIMMHKIQSKVLGVACIESANKSGGVSEEYLQQAEEKIKKHCVVSIDRIIKYEKKRDAEAEKALKASLTRDSKGKNS